MNALKLTRKTTESIVIGDNVTVTIESVSGDRVHLSIVAPLGIPVYRKEVRDRIDRELNS